jgi:hypothetical protein
MVKTLPTIERSTKIRFGKNVQEDQGENTIVLNASNTVVDASDAGAVYITPVRNFRDYVGKPEVVLMMYNTLTKELTESGESAQDIIGNVGLDEVANQGNATSNTIIFNNNTTAIVTTGKVGIANTSPGHTLSIGSNVYIDDIGPSNVLVVNGGVSIEGNLAVNGGITTITTENLIIEDAIIEIGKNNTSEDTTLDLGLIMTRPGSNVTVGFKEVENEMVLAYTQSSAYSNTITPIVSEDLDVHVYGGVLTESNVGIKTTNPDAELHVVGNVYVSSNLTVDGDTLHVDAENDSVGINTKNPNANLHVVGNVYVSSNLTVDTDTFHVDVENKSVGIETKNPDANLHVVGNVYVSSNLTVDGDTLHVDVENKSVGIETKNPDANLHVVGNVYVSSNLTVDGDTLHVDVENKSVGIETKNPDANLHVVGNVYVSSNLTVDGDTLHVDVENKSVGIETKNPDANLHVVGNVYVSSNLTVDTDTFHVDIVNDSVGVGTVNPDANLHVVGNVYVSSNLTVDTDTLHVDVENDSVGINTKNPNAELHVVGNVYVSSNLTVDTDTLHVDSVNKRVGIETVNPTSNLHVVGNAYVSSNLTTDGTLTLNHPTTAILTDLTSNVEVKLNQLANVSINTTDVDESLRSDHVLVYDGVNWVNEYPAHNYIRFYNDSGSTLYSGNCVYIVGHHNANLVEVGLASATSADTMPSIGIVYNTSVAQGDQGVAVAYGKVNQMDTSGFLEGDTLYVSNVNAGLLSNVKPYGVDLDLIQNIGVCTRSDPNSGTIFVTGVGRSNDIPNARIVLDEGDINYVYVNDQNNDLKKIEPSNLLTQLQTFEQVSAAGNVVSNIMSFTNSTTSIVTTSNAIVGGNISVADLTDPLKKHLPMVDSDGFFEKSPVYIEKSSGKYVISASEAEFLGNITLSGNTTILNSESVTISDRIFGVAANNSASQLDSGFLIEHQEGDPLEYANVALIYHADEHRFSLSYTQNTFTDNHILHLDDADHRMLIDFYGNVEVRHDLIVEENMNVVGTSLLSGDLTVGGASNLFVDVSTSNVGINEGTPLRNLDVNGDARIQDTTDTSSTSGGALVVLGGLGVASNIHSTNVYAGSHVGVGTISTTRPVHVMANSVGGVYINGDGNDARVALEATGTTADPVASFTVNGGEAFSVGIDNSINDTFNISNHASDVGTNARLTMTPAGITTLTNTTDATSTTDGALIVSGGLGVAQSVYATTFRGTTITGTNLYGTLAGSNTAAVSDLTASAMVKGTTITGTNLYGTLAGSNTVAASDITASGTVKGATLTGTNLYGTLAGSNTVAASDITASGTVKGATLTGTNVYGTLAGSNTAAVSDLTASAMVKAATISGTNVYGTLAGSNTAAVSDITASGTVKGATLTGTNLYGTLAGSNTAAVSDLTASAMVKAATISGTNVYGTLAGSNTAAVSDLTASAMVKGATLTGTNLYGTLAGSNAAAMTTLSASGVVTLTDATEATSSTTGALKAAGGVGIAKDVYVGERAYVTGGLITNTGQVTKKTYSFTGALDSGQTVADSTIKITFSAHVFYAKIVAHLIESDDEVSTLSMECGGGHRTGGTPLTIAKGPTSVFGSASTNPWNSAVATTTTTVAFAPTTDMAAAGNYNIFIEYISAHASGAVTKITEGSTDVVTFGY